MIKGRIKVFEKRMRVTYISGKGQRSTVAGLIKFITPKKNTIAIAITIITLVNTGKPLIFRYFSG